MKSNPTVRIGLSVFAIGYAVVIWGLCHEGRRLMEVLTNIAAAIGAIVTVGGGVAWIAYSVFKTLGEKWLEQKFATQLEAFKHEQQKEMEQVRYRVNSLFDRAVRLHQAEFEVVPEAWALMRDAHRQASYFLALGRMVPDWNKMDQIRFDETLEASGLKKWEKEELRNATDKTSYYANAIFWHELHDARLAHQAFEVYLAKKGVFMSPDLEAKFTDLCSIIRGALIEKEIGGVRKFDYYKQEDNRRFRDTTLVEEIRAKVRGTLWDSKSPEAA
jgi:hypothetical protein